MVKAVNQEADLPLFTAASRKFLTVSELNELIKGTLESQLDAVWVQGEISNFRVPPSGHCYFTLKDSKSQICGVMFRRQGASLRFTPENGMAVLCLGRVSLYSVRGDLQLYVEDMEPQGQGALFVAFEQLKIKLAAEGLFAPQRKKPLPVVPSSIGMVTSDRGAALHDMLRIVCDRYPDRRIVIRPVKVQGRRSGGPSHICFQCSGNFGGRARNRFYHRGFCCGSSRADAYCGSGDGRAAQSRFARSGTRT